MDMKSFYKDKRVLITGHTGFKGSWLSMMMDMLRADVYGYSLNPPTEPNIYTVAGIDKIVDSTIADIRDLGKLKETFDRVKPEIVFHMAAQPIVRESYKNPIYTYETNVMGTVNVLECIRNCDSVRSVINITTDKVYRNEEREEGYCEEEYLDGYDPYSNSKSCSELVTSSYRNSFFSDGRECAISTCRAGNVIGGGDFATDRIIPDCVRAAIKGETIIVRNPYSTRPYQHVLEPVYAYALLAMEQAEKPSLIGSYNIGPDDSDCRNTGDLVDLFCEKWNDVTGQNVEWKNVSDNGPHEASFLKLDCTKFKNALGWQPQWKLEECMERLVEWYAAWMNEDNVKEIMNKQISCFDI